MTSCEQRIRRVIVIFAWPLGQSPISSGPLRKPPCPPHGAAPGQSRQEYLRWRLVSVWPVAGLLLGAIVAATSWNAVGPNSAVPIGEGVWLASALVIWLAARKVVSRVHTGWVDGSIDDRDGRIDRMEELAAQIETAFDDYRHGRIY